MTPRLERVCLLCLFAAGAAVLVWSAVRLLSARTRPYRASELSAANRLSDAERRLFEAGPVRQRLDGDTDVDGFDLSLVPRPPSSHRTASGAGPGDRSAMYWALYEMPGTADRLTGEYARLLREAGWMEWPFFRQKWSTSEAGPASIYRHGNLMLLVASGPAPEGQVGVYVQLGIRPETVPAEYGKIQRPEEGNRQ